MKKNGFLKCVIVAIALFGITSCEYVPREAESVARLEALLQKLEKNWSTGNGVEPSTVELQKIRDAWQDAVKVDPAILTKEWEQRRDNALSDAQLYVLVLLDDVTDQKNKQGREE